MKWGLSNNDKCSCGQNYEKTTTLAKVKEFGNLIIAYYTIWNF
jgi:hypothetical protein